MAAHLAPFEEALLASVREAVSSVDDERLEELLEALRRAAARPAYASQLRTVRQLADECPAFKREYLYKLIAEAEINGLAEFGAVVRQDRRVLLHIERFGEWLAAREMKAVRGVRPGTSRPSARRALRSAG